MHKRTILTGYASIFLLLAMLVTLSMTPVGAAGTWTVDDDGAADFSTIQAAINAASDGDTIQVASGIYYEHVVVNKSLTLVGEDSRTTIIDGNGTGIVVRIKAPYVDLTGFTVQNSGKGFADYGIELYSCNSSIIVGNKIINNSNVGILIRDSSNNVIHYNTIANNSMGVDITSESSLLNMFYHNNFIDNTNHAGDDAKTTKWDNGEEGNYWSDYDGNDTNGNGIGEDFYVVPVFGKDYFPLMEPWSPYRVFSYNVTTFSNSTLASFNFSQQLKQISFNATSGASGFCNVTIPKTLLNVSAPEKWKVIIDGRLLSTGNRTVTENATHASIYFTYTAGGHKVQITTVSSTISIALSSTTTTLGSNVTISGNITAEDPVNPMRPNATLTIQSRPIGSVTWHTVSSTVKTDSNSNYTYTWTPETGGIHEVMARWEGDNETVGGESDVLVLTVIYVFEPEGVYIETNSTVAEFNSTSAFNFNQQLKQISFNVTSLYGTVGYSNVTIPKELLAPENGWKVIINGTLLSAEEIIATENATHTFIYFTYSKGINIVQITIRMSSTISLALSSDSISLGSNVTISGNITAEDLTARPNAPVTIQSRPSGDVEWTTLTTVETDLNGIYSYDWKPEKTGTYEIKASWPGDEFTLGNETDAQTLTVKWSSIISIVLSSANIAKGKSVTISGGITVADNIARTNVNVTILYKLSSAAEWTTLTIVETDESGNYTYAWKPDATGTYEIKASWLGDDVTFGNQSDVLTLKVEKAPEGIPVEIVVVAVVAIIIIASVVIYFVKHKKP